MVGVAIYDILKNDSAVSALVGTKIYPMQAKESDSAPYITYQVISDVPANTKQTAALIDHYRIQISSFATRYDRAELLAKKAKDALDNHALESYTNDTHTIKVTSIKFDDEIPLHDDSANLFEIVQDYMVTAYITQKTFTDYFLPSKDLLAAMYTNLHAESLGNFGSWYYWSSSEVDADQAYAQYFTNGTVTQPTKNTGYSVRACRVFVTAAAGAYSLGDTGPAGGLICFVNDNVYYEAAPSDQANIDNPQVWSNVASTAVTGTGTAVGTGQDNTNDIIAQGGHTDSAAKLCDDLTI